jgi:hypothetical protein
MMLCKDGSCHVQDSHARTEARSVRLIGLQPTRGSGGDRSVSGIKRFKALVQGYTQQAGGERQEALQYEPLPLAKAASGRVHTQRSLSGVDEQCYALGALTAGEDCVCLKHTRVDEATRLNDRMPY